MATSTEWDNWESGDCLYAPEVRNGCLPQKEITERLMSRFANANVDWSEGNRWVEARILRAMEIGYTGSLLDSEYLLRDNVALVTVQDHCGEASACVKFYMTPDTGTLELHYEPDANVDGCRLLSAKIAETLGYELGS